MAWSAPRTWVVGQIVSAASLNQDIRDNLNYLRSNAINTVATSESTTSTVFADLTTVGPAVTVTTDVQAVVMLYGLFSNNTATYRSSMGFAVSGATTIAASDSYSAMLLSGGPNYDARLSASFLVVGLTAGSNTFTAKYKAQGYTSTFADRRITVIPS